MFQKLLTNHRARSGRRLFKVIVGLSVVGLYAPVACIATGDDTEETRSALGAFDPWHGGGVLLSRDTNSMAQLSSTTMSLFSVSGGIVQTSFQRNGVWTNLQVGTRQFVDRPAVAGFAVSSGPLFNTFAIVARASDGTYSIRIQNQDGSSVVQDWTALPGSWTSVPAVAFVPPNSGTSQSATLFVVGRGQDNRFWEIHNTLSAQLTYSQSNWTGTISPFGSQTFTSGPALTYSCPPFAGSPSLVIAGASGQSFLVSTYAGSSWSSWTTQNGAFLSGPALAAGCGEFTSEVTLYGLGLDQRVWVGTVVPGTPAGFAPIGTRVFVGTPTATGLGNRVTVGGRDGTGGAAALGANPTLMSSATSP